MSRLSTMNVTHTLLHAPTSRQSDERCAVPRDVLHRVRVCTTAASPSQRATFPPANTALVHCSNTHLSTRLLMWLPSCLGPARGMPEQPAVLLSKQIASHRLLEGQPPSQYLLQNLHFPAPSLLTQVSVNVSSQFLYYSTEQRSSN